MIVLIALFCFCFAALAWSRYRSAVFILIAALPTYLIRFTVWRLPTTLLETMFGVLLLVWLLRFARRDWPGIKNFFATNRFFLVAFSLFGVASIAGILVSDQWYISLGQWRAYFFEPVIFFVVLVGRRESISPAFLIRALLVAAIPVSLVALGQKFWPSLYPPSLWDDNTMGRVTSFFTTPNAIGLFIVPPIVAGFSFLTSNQRDRALWIVATGLGLVALVLSQSVGAFLGLAGGIVVLVGLLYSRRLAIAAILLGVLLVALPPSRALLAHKSASMQNRFTLWRYSETFLTANPKNFVLGAGIRQFFRKVQKPYYTVGGELERLIYPHNILLNFWCEIGLLGMLGFLGMYYFFACRVYQEHRSGSRAIGAAVLAGLVALFVHGLVDVPYFKNDLAMLFWVLAAASLPRPAKI